MRRFSQFYPTSARRRKGSRRRHGGRRGRRCFGRHRGAVALSPCVFFWRSGLRLWGKGVVTHPPQDDKMTRCGRRGNFQFYTKKKRGSFPSQTLHSKTGNLLWWWMPRPKQKRESRAPTISFKSQRRRRGKGRAKTATARQHVGGPPDPVVKHHGVAYPHGHGDGGAARDLLVPRAGRTP